MTNSSTYRTLEIFEKSCCSPSISIPASSSFEEENTFEAKLIPEIKVTHKNGFLINGTKKSHYTKNRAYMHKFFTTLSDLFFSFSAFSCQSSSCMAWSRPSRKERIGYMWRPPPAFFLPTHPIYRPRIHLSGPTHHTSCPKARVYTHNN